MTKVVTLGEIMMRLMPPNHERFIQATTFESVYGGAEANVAIGLANFGLDVDYVTKLPDNPLGDAAINQLRKYGVGTRFIRKGGQRMGLYFIEKGASVRPTKVIYDRKNSSMSEATVSDFDFDEILEGAGWFHFTGITPAISEDGLKITLKALQECRRKGITVSMDFNYREGLWDKEVAKIAYQQLMPYVDVCIANEMDAESFLDITVSNTQNVNGVLSPASYEEIYNRMMDQYKLLYIVSTKREVISSEQHKYSAQIYDGNDIYHSKTYHLNILDRIGGGDAFASGLIYGLKMNDDPQKAIDFATASAAIKHTINGDANLITIDEVMNLVHQDNIRVKR